jgi:hypothetical protein
MLWRTRFTASTQPILLRMGPQPLKVPHGTVLFLTIRFARSSSCHGPRFEVFFGWMLLPLEMSQHCHKHLDGRCNHKYVIRKYVQTNAKINSHTVDVITCKLIHRPTAKQFTLWATWNENREPHTANLPATGMTSLIRLNPSPELCLVLCLVTQVRII